MKKETALEILRELHDKALFSERTALETLVPELAVSEDERIRKGIITYLEKSQFGEEHYCVDDDIVRDYIAWLEKQNEPQDKGEISDGYHTFNELYYYRMLYNAAFFNTLPKEWVHKSKKHHDGEECFGGGWFIVMANLPTGQISNHYELKDWDLFQIPEREVADEWDGHTPQEAADRLYKYLLEKQGEKPNNKVKPKFKPGDTIRCKYDTRKFTIKTVDLEGGIYTYTQDGCGNDIDYADEEFELVEQKPVDKVGPKFKVGDWVVNKFGHLKYITKIENHCYHAEGECGEWHGTFEYGDTHFHLWTIQDAKDGDVLVFDDIIMIFKNIKTVCTANTYFLYCDGIAVDDWCDFGHNARPATKEQRGILSSKMKEAGYEWDAEKKELRKIEQKPALSEEDERKPQQILENY